MIVLCVCVCVCVCVFRGADDAGVAVAHHGRVPHRIFRRISFVHLRRARSLSHRARAAHHISGERELTFMTDLWLHPS